MRTYTIEDLTTKQKFLVDLIWGMDDNDTVVSFIQSLKGQDRYDASSLSIMLMHEYIEELVELQEPDGFVEAREVLEKIMEK